MCVQTWISEDPLPGHRASSTPGCAAGAAVRRPWPPSAGCSPPAADPGPGGPSPCCAAAVAASSLAHSARSAQPSDWTSTQGETSSANTNSEQTPVVMTTCPSTNPSVLSASFIPMALPHLKHPSVQTVWEKLVEDKTREKFLCCPHGQHDGMCLHPTLHHSPTLPPLLPIPWTVPQSPVPLSLFKSPPRQLLRNRRIKEFGLGLQAGRG